MNRKPEAPEILRAEVSRRIAAATEADDRFTADITRFIRGRAVTEFDPRHPVIVLPVERERAEDAERDGEAAA